MNKYILYSVIFFAGASSLLGMGDFEITNEEGLEPVTIQDIEREDIAIQVLMCHVQNIDVIRPLYRKIKLVVQNKATSDIIKKTVKEVDSSLDDQAELLVENDLYTKFCALLDYVYENSSPNLYEDSGYENLGLGIEAEIILRSGYLENIDDHHVNYCHLLNRYEKQNISFR